MIVQKSKLHIYKYMYVYIYIYIYMEIIHNIYVIKKIYFEPKKCFQFL